jgi:hypothetical protein
MSFYDSDSVRDGRSSPRRPTLAHGLVAAVALSLAGGAVLAALALVLDAGTAFRAVVAMLGFAYVLYLLGQSGRRAGRATALVAWCLAAAMGWLLAPPLGVYVLLHVGLIWLVRSLYFHSSPLSALADLGVAALGTAFAVWAGLRSGTAGVALWCFFLVQAFFISIPAAVGHGRAGRRIDADDAALGGREPFSEQALERAFERAHRAAETALRRLAANSSAPS